MEYEEEKREEIKKEFQNNFNGKDIKIEDLKKIAKEKETKEIEIEKSTTMKT